MESNDSATELPGPVLSRTPAPSAALGRLGSTRFATIDRHHSRGADVKFVCIYAFQGVFRSLKGCHYGIQRRSHSVCTQMSCKMVSIVFSTFLRPMHRPCARDTAYFPKYTVHYLPSRALFRR